MYKVPVMKKLYVLLICVTTLFTQQIYAQTGNIEGAIYDAQHGPLTFATILLYNASDTTLTKVEYSDDNGAFLIKDQNQGEYWIEVNYVGLPSWRSELIGVQANQTTKMNDIILEDKGTELEEIVVTARRPIVEIKPDRTVFNVEGSVAATGSDALELLKKSPGVVVDNNDNIIVEGKSGVVIYINGRPSHLSQEDVVEMLKSMRSSEIEAIEIITNPSARFDAEGNAGIINLRMKKQKGMGTNASLNVNYGIGIKPKYYAGINVNHRSEKVNVFGSYGYRNAYNINDVNFYREQLGESFTQRSDMEGHRRGHRSKIGADFFLSAKSTLGVVANINRNKADWYNNSKTAIRQELGGDITSNLLAKTDRDEERKYTDASINYQFNNEGKIWTADVSYGVFSSDADALQPNQYTNADKTEVLSETTFRTVTPTTVGILAFKLDHEREFLGGKLETGLKFSSVKTDNTYEYYDIEGEEEILNHDYSNTFVFTENIPAAYVSYQRQIKKLGVQAGLRVEHTNSTGELSSMQQVEHNNVTRDYTDFFPSAGLTYQMDEKNMFRFNYSRRINRPDYSDLNPFEFKLDELTYERGNPWLQPEYSNKVELTHSYNYSLNTSLSYSYTQDYFTKITDTTEMTKSFISQQNLSNQKTFALSISSPLPITKWWSSYTNVTGYYQENSADFGEGKEININVKAWNIYSQHTFTLPKGIALEVSGFYNSPNIWGGTFKNEAMWGMDAGIKTKVLEGRGSLKLSVSDIFGSMRWRGVSNFGGLYMDAHGGWESQRLNVNFTYLLGDQGVKKSRRRGSALDDAASRVGSGGN